MEAKISIRLDQVTRDKLQKAADKADRKLSDFIRLLLQKSVKSL